MGMEVIFGPIDQQLVKPSRNVNLRSWGGGEEGMEHLAEMADEVGASRVRITSSSSGKSKVSN